MGKGAGSGAKRNMHALSAVKGQVWRVLRLPKNEQSGKKAAQSYKVPLTAGKCSMLSETRPSESFPATIQRASVYCSSGGQTRVWVPPGEGAVQALWQETHLGACLGRTRQPSEDKHRVWISLRHWRFCVFRRVIDLFELCCRWRKIIPVVVGRVAFFFFINF